MIQKLERDQLLAAPMRCALWGVGAYSPCTHIWRDADSLTPQGGSLTAQVLAGNRWHRCCRFFFLNPTFLSLKKMFY